MSVAAALRPDENAAASLPLLAIEELTVRFATARGRLDAVAGVTLDVRPGETLAIVGESGSGKSVTGLALMRLLDRTTAEVTATTCRYRRKDGWMIDLVTCPEAEMRAVRGAEIAMIFQDPLSSLNPVFRIGEQIAEAIRWHRGIGGREARYEAGRLLDEVGIAGGASRLDDYPHELSGGMRQRIVIAIALACDPQLLIADEPTTALDVTIQAQIITLLKRQQAERGMAMIFVTHDLGLVEEVADRVAVMYAGRIVEEGPADAVLGRPLHPYTRALLDCNPHFALRAMTEGARAELRPIPGQPADPMRRPWGCSFHPRCPLAIDACRKAPPPTALPATGRTTRCIRWEALA
jgi:oligopeptide/dipeptide ABC transporter ATP-binding protein